MRYFYDTEFYEDGKQIHMISIGIVAQDGRELYMERQHFDWSMVPEGHFVSEHVQPWLHPEHEVWPHDIGEHVREFIVDQAPKEKHELWGYYSAYDHVVLAQLYGRMVDMPEGIPWFTHDLKQTIDRLVPDETPPPQDGVEHHALADARWNKKVYDWLNDWFEEEVK
jgi:hypothetical protein